MAIAIYGFTLVVPLVSIEKGWTGGVQAFLERTTDSLGKRVWLDDQLVGIWYHDWENAYRQWEHWHSGGFRAKSLNGLMSESELLATLVDHSMGLSLMECNWLEIDPAFPCVWLRGHPRGNVAVPSSLKDKLPLEDPEALAAAKKRAAEEARRARPAVSRKDLGTLEIDLPEEQHRITAGREYSAEQWALIQRGLLPESMDEKWIAFVEGHRLMVLRSWTGWLFADATFEPAAEGMRLAHFLAEDEPTVPAEYQRDLLYWVIDALILGNPNAVLPEFKPKAYVGSGRPYAELDRDIPRESISFNNGRGRRLAGTLFLGSGSSVVVLVHGPYSDQAAGGSFNRLAFLLVRDGYNVLTFDLTGCGESAPETVTPQTMQEDVAAALAYARSCGYARVALFVGGWWTSQIARVKADVQAIIMTSPGPISSDGSSFFDEAEIDELRRTGTVTVRAIRGKKAPVTLGVEMLDDAVSGEAAVAALMAGIGCPTFIVRARDYIEPDGLLIVNRLIARLPAGSAVGLVPHVDPRFRDYDMDRVMKVVRPWLKTHFPPK